MQLTARIAWAIAVTIFIVTPAACRSGGDTTTRTEPEISDQVEAQIEDTVEQAGEAAIELEPTYPRWSAAIERIGTDIGVNGEAIVTAGATGFFTEIDLEGAEPGSVHPWHVHDGNCGEGGVPVGDASAYPPITVGEGGEGEAEANIGQSLNEEADYSVNIHLSPSQIDSIIACGELVQLEVPTQ